MTLVEHVRAIGIDRFRFGTDWPVVEAQLALDLGRRVPLTDTENDHFANTTAPWPVL